MTVIKRTKTHQIIKGVVFDNDYIYFKSNAAWQYIPDEECFVHVWQKSSSMVEFLENMKLLFDSWTLGESGCQKSAMHWCTRGYGKSSIGLEISWSSANARKNYYRRKGVKLKTLPHWPESCQKEKWKNIARLAEDSLN